MKKTWLACCFTAALSCGSERGNDLHEEVVEPGTELPSIPEPDENGVRVRQGGETSDFGGDDYPTCLRGRAGVTVELKVMTA